jgi:hypothetical protein
MAHRYCLTQCPSSGLGFALKNHSKNPYFLAQFLVFFKNMRKFYATQLPSPPIRPIIIKVMINLEGTGS